MAKARLTNETNQLQILDTKFDELVSNGEIKTVRGTHGPHSCSYMYMDMLMFQATFNSQGRLPA